MLNSKFFLLFVSCLCIGCVFVARESRDDPTIKTLELQLKDLHRQLEGLDEIREDLIRDEIEEGWNKQHLAELKDRRAELSSNLKHMSETFKESANNLKDNNKEMARYLAAMHEHNTKLREKEALVVHQLDEESSKAHEKVHLEHEENAALKEILSEMRQLLDIEKSKAVTREGIRGAQNSEQT